MDYFCNNLNAHAFLSNDTSFSFSFYSSIISQKGLLIITDTEAKIVYTFSPERILSKDGEILISGNEYPASLYLGAIYTPNNSTTGMMVTIHYVIMKSGKEVCSKGKQLIIKCYEGCTSCNEIIIHF